MAANILGRDDFHLSHSSVVDFLRCPACWKAQRIDRMPRKVSPALAIGSSLHGAMAALRRGQTPDDAVDAARVEIGRTLMGEDRTGELPDADPVLDLGTKFSSWSAVEEEALRLVPALVPIAEAERGWEVLAVEKALDFEGVFDVPFVGFVDVVLRQADRVVVKDLKSAGTNMGPGDTAWRQLATYTLSHDFKTDHVGVDVVVKNKTAVTHVWTEPGYSGQIPDALRQSVVGQVNYVAAAVERGDFPVGDGGVFGHPFEHPSVRFYIPDLAVAS